MAENDDSRGTNSSSVPPEIRPPEVKDLGVELGVDQTMPFNSPFFDNASGREKIFEVLNPESEYNGPTTRQLKAMRRLDGQARALYRLLTLPLRAALSSSSFIPEEGGEEEAEFIKACFFTPPSNGGMTVTFHRFMGQLLSGLFDGFSAFEKVYWKPEVGPLKGKYTLKKLAYRPSDTITFLTTENGGFAGLRQRAYLNGKTVDVKIDAPYAFYFAAQEEERKFYGVSFFESAYYHFDKKSKIYFVAHLAAQRSAVGTRVGTVPPGATTKAKNEFAANLKSLAAAQWMMIPEGFKVEMLRDSGSFDFLQMINHHNSQMSKSVLANFFDKDQGASGADKSLVTFGQPGDAMFVLMLRAIMEDVANSINHYIIPALIDLNFKTSKYPKFTWGKLTDEQKQAIADTFDKLAVAGSPAVSEEFIRELEKHQAEEFGFEIDWDAVDKREEEERALMSEQMVPGGGAGGNPGRIAQGQEPPAASTGPVSKTKNAKSAANSTKAVDSFVKKQTASLSAAEAAGVAAIDDAIDTMSDEQLVALASQLLGDAMGRIREEDDDRED